MFTAITAEEARKRVEVFRAADTLLDVFNKIKTACAEGKYQTRTRFLKAGEHIFLHQHGYNIKKRGSFTLINWEA